jgi:amino acid permease
MSEEIQNSLKEPLNLDGQGSDDEDHEEHQESVGELQERPNFRRKPANFKSMPPRYHNETEVQPASIIDEEVPEMANSEISKRMKFDRTRGRRKSASEGDDAKNMDGKRKTWSQRTFSNIEAGSMRGSYFTLLSTAFGAVVLSLPYMMSTCGIVLGIAFIIANGFINLWSLHVLSRVSFKTNTFQYSEAVEKTMGRKYGLVFSWIMISYCFGTVVSYFITLNQFVISFMESIGLISSVSEQNWITPGDNQYYHTYIILILIAFLGYPIAALRNLSSFRHLALFGCIVVFYIFFVIIGEMPVLFNQNLPEVEFFIFDWNTLAAWVVATYSYTMQVNFFPIRVELQRPSFVRMKKISNRLLYTLMSVYCVISTMGYLSLGSNTPQIYIDRTSSVGWHDFWMTIGKGMMTINIFFAIPLNLSPCRLEVLILLKKDKNTSNLAHHTSTAFLMAACAMVAMFIPHVVTALGILGGICSTSLCATFPAFMLLKVEDWTEENKNQKRLVQLIGYGGSTLGLIGAGVIILQTIGILPSAPSPT